MGYMCWYMCDGVGFGGVSVGSIRKDLGTSFSVDIHVVTVTNRHTQVRE